jgi:hypothetical protein
MVINLATSHTLHLHLHMDKAIRHSNSLSTPVPLSIQMMATMAVTTRGFNYNNRLTAISANKSTHRLPAPHPASDSLDETDVDWKHCSKSVRERPEIANYYVDVKIP